MSEAGVQYNTVTNLTTNDPLNKICTTVSLLLSNHVVLIGEGVALERDGGSREESNNVHVFHHVAQHVWREEELEKGCLKFCVQYIVCEPAILPTGLQSICFG